MPSVAERPVDRAEAFAGRIMQVLDAGATSMMLSVGHRLGLFDAMAGMPPATSEQVAQVANLSERYVREWLAVMVTSGIVIYEPRTGHYHLPAEHADCLTRDARLGNLAVYGQMVALMGVVQDRIIECFRSGAGTTYDDYPGFHHCMAEDSGQTVTAQLFDTLLPMVPGLAARLESGIEVLDAGCGRGSALLAMAQRFPASRFVGIDLCADAIDHARCRADELKLANVAFVARDLTGFAEPDRFDFITSFDAVHDQGDPQGLVRSLRDALRPGGVYLMQDIGGSARLENNRDFPFAAFLYAISTCHCTPVSIGQGGAGLGTMWGWETAEALLKESGFASVERHVLPHDPMNVWFVSKA